MEKNKKMLLIGGGIAALGLVTVLYIKSKNTSTLGTSSISTNGNCPAGQVPCANNRLKCYNPSANYIVDPCAVTGGNQLNNPIANPIAEIVDGLIGLFKKKKTTTA